MSRRDRSVWIWIVLAALPLCFAGCGGAGPVGKAAAGDPPATPLSVATTTLPAGTTGQAYAATLAATGGTAPYSWAITQGQLPSGLSLAASGAVSGTPQSAGSATITAQVIDSKGAAATAAVSISIAAAGSSGSGGAGTATLDEYGGAAAADAPGGGTGYFRVTKVGPRWILVDPAGHPFWMLGVFDVDQGASPDAAQILARYGSWQTWGVQAARRLQAWGFNTAAEYSNAAVMAVDQSGPRNTTAPIPAVLLVRPAYYALINQNDYAPQPVKSLLNGMDSHYSGYAGATLPDVFDPNFAAYANAMLAAQTSTAEADSPWIVGTAVGDLDDLWGFGAGPDEPTSPPGQASENIGWLVLCTDFQQTSNSQLGETYSDAKVYTKYALASYLQQKYSTIAALNAAWGSDYTSFGDAGGFGGGTGLLDEDGRDGWVGDDITLQGETAAMQGDLNGFLSAYADEFFSIVTSAVRKYRPNQLVFGPATMNSWSGVSRAEVLAAAAKYCDIIQASAADQADYDFTLAHAGDKPLVAWTGITANPDSDLSAYAHTGDLSSQAARGAAYAQITEQLFQFAGSSSNGALAGSHNFVGEKWWAWADSNAEKANWGLVTFLDNAYDGKEDVIAAGKDVWGFATGGEAANYGDFITAAKAANQQIQTDLLQAVP
ncbi:MAG: Ig domain-containing protein [Terriglobales bacterium]